MSFDFAEIYKGMIKVKYQFTIHLRKKQWKINESGDRSKALKSGGIPQFVTSFRSPSQLKSVNVKYW